MLSELKEVKHQIVRNKAKGQVCFKKTNYVCVSGGKKCSFLGKFDVFCFLETPVLRFTFSPYYGQNNIEKNLGEHAPGNYGLLHWRQCYLMINFLIQPRFPKSRTQFLCYNIARNEEGFGVLLFYYILKTRKLSLKWFKIQAFKVSFFKSFFDDSGDMLYLEQTETCHIFHVACFNSLVRNR